MRKKNKEIVRPMVKKLVKIKSLRANRLRGFRTCLDLGFGGAEKGRRVWAQPPRRVLKAITVVVVVVEERALFLSVCECFLGEVFNIYVYSNASDGKCRSLGGDLTCLLVEPITLEEPILCLFFSNF